MMLHVFCTDLDELVDAVQVIISPRSLFRDESLLQCGEAAVHVML